jgi:peroxiredoxin (alkyl hydroperoxide reductase subunit C)
MPEQFKAGCQRPAKKKIISEEPSENVVAMQKEEEQSMIKVGKPAPDFSAPAYYKGQFANVDLSEYKGKWLVLCFYPGDFTFV